MKLDFDIDDHLNRFIPARFLHRLPRWLSWGLGYRTEVPKRVPTVFVWFWTFIGAFCGVSVVQAVFERSQYFLDRHVVNIVGSFGATAVLLYGVIEAPFAQPRAIFFGHTISALIGVSITKLFLHLPPDSFQENLWLAGALSCAAASTLMAITKTIHPPSGGTALIAATQADVRALGWYYVPVVMLSSVLMIAVGLITNNIQRQYPIYWWTSAPLKPVSQKEKHEKDGNTSMELRENSTTKVNDLEKGLEVVIITAQKVMVPEFIRLSYDQKAVLNEIQTEIKEHYNITDE